MTKGVGIRPRLSDVLYTDLLSEISQGKLTAGARLPSEAEISLQFGVSRPIVREALGRLREEGFIQSRKGSGSFVAPAAQGSVALGPSHDRRVSSLSDIQKLYQYRQALEGEIAYLAAGTRTAEQLKAIEDAVDELGSIDAATSDGTEEDIRFHRAIALSTDNAFFVDALDRVVADMRFIVQLARSLLMKQPTRNIETVQREHRVIVDAIRDKDQSAAREHMQFHLRTAQARLFFGGTEPGSSLW